MIWKFTETLTKQLSVVILDSHVNSSIEDSTQSRCRELIPNSSPRLLFPTNCIPFQCNPRSYSHSNSHFRFPFSRYKFHVTSILAVLISCTSQSTRWPTQCTSARLPPAKFPSSRSTPATCICPSSQKHPVWRFRCRQQWLACTIRTISTIRRRKDAWTSLRLSRPEC